MHKRTEETPRDRTFTDDEIRVLWTESGRRASGDVYKLMLLTGQRSGEVKAMGWEDIAKDVWTIPAELSKNGRQHRVPLSSQAAAVLNARRREAGGHQHVFQSPAGGSMYWLGRTTKRVQKAVGFHFTPHDLRRTCATRLARLGTSDAIIGRILNHQWALKNVTARVYLVDDRLAEKQAALQSWADELDRVLKAKNAGEHLKIALGASPSP